MSSPFDPRGSLWHKWDLHFHTPSSYDYENRSITNQQIVDGLLTHNVTVVAITDHHIMDADRISDLQRLGAEKLTVLPGLELRSDQGGDPIHYSAFSRKTVICGTFGPRCRESSASQRKPSQPLER